MKRGRPRIWPDKHIYRQMTCGKRANGRTACGNAQGFKHDGDVVPVTPEWTADRPEVGDLVGLAISDTQILLRGRVMKRFVVGGRLMLRTDLGFRVGFGSITRRLSACTNSTPSKRPMSLPC